MHAGLHHDGSPLHVDASRAALGGVVPLRVRVARALAVEAVVLRTVIDGEPQVRTAHIVAEAGPDDWWGVDMPLENPLQGYRFRVTGGLVGYAWLTAAGVFGHDVTDAHDFLLHVHGASPRWVDRAVVYQMFPDRFASSGAQRTPPEWAVPRHWEQTPEGRSANTAREWFAGDLDGITAHLDHLQSLGVNVLYCTPVFPARSTHRYDASTFDEVDPLLGGDDALVRLVEAAHARGMRVLGDLTTNHCGAAHEWFVRAQDGDPTTRDFFTFDAQYAHGYASWMGVPSLPKFDFRSAQLRRRLITDEDSVIRRWLRAPFHLDGWRIDVANMTARLGDYDANHEVARLARTAVRAEGADKVLIAEHFHDAGPDLPGDGWDGAMNYAAFTRPVWAWLRDPQYEAVEGLSHTDTPRLDGVAMVAQMHSFAARMPWDARRASWNILGSHDTPRIRSIVGSSERQVAAAALMATLPGSPMVFAGDEVGVRGRWGEDARRPFPWHAEADWDRTVLDAYRALLALRTSSDALAVGGLRWIAVAPEHVAFLRESPSERLLVVVTRGGVPDIRLDAAAYGIASLRPLFGFDAAIRDAHVHIQAPDAGAGIWRIP